jgi:hypothetical protein
LLKNNFGHHPILTCAHVGHGEVDRLLPDGRDGQVNDSQVGLLVLQLPDNTVPLSVIPDAAVFAVAHHVNRVLELKLLCQMEDEIEDVALVLLRERHPLQGLFRNLLQVSAWHRERRILQKPNLTLSLLYLEFLALLRHAPTRSWSHKHLN